MHEQRWPSEPLPQLLSAPHVLRTTIQGNAKAAWEMDNRYMRIDASIDTGEPGKTLNRRMVRNIRLRWLRGRALLPSDVYRSADGRSTPMGGVLSGKQLARRSSTAM